MQSLKLKEWAEIERRTGLGMSELTQDGAPAALLTACMLTIAKKRLGPGFTFEMAEDMPLTDAGEEMQSAIEKLGFSDDEEELDPKAEKQS